jgi:hypothetical protein
MPYLKKDPFCFFLLMLWAGFVSGQANYQEASSAIQEENAPLVEAIFVVHLPVRDTDRFRDLAEQIARLSPFGRIDMTINFTAEKAAFKMPEGGSPWHEYARL